MTTQLQLGHLEASMAESGYLPGPPRGQEALWLIEANAANYSICGHCYQSGLCAVCFHKGRVLLTVFVCPKCGRTYGG